MIDRSRAYTYARTLAATAYMFAFLFFVLLLGSNLTNTVPQFTPQYVPQLASFAPLLFSSLAVGVASTLIMLVTRTARKT